MILIADSGGTKVEWCLLDARGVKMRFDTPGMNAMMLSAKQMEDRIATEVAPQIQTWIPEIDHVYFYGAGCVSEGVCSAVADAIKSIIPVETIEVATDMLGAARALCADHPGIVCILGTGSNSCYYDGSRILNNVSPLGFILGDEGSGAYLGKILVGDVLKRQLPADICAAFAQEYGLSTADIVERVYRQPYPNKFLASFTPFLSKHISNPAVKALVVDAFKAFFRRNVCLYPTCFKLDIHFCGSIAQIFKEQLIEAAESLDLSLCTIQAAPMQGLIDYHTKLHNN